VVLMATQTIEKRVERLERRVTNLERLPERMDRVESQIVQVRTEMHDEFSAVREDIRAGDEETRRLMRVLHEDVIGRFALLTEGRVPGVRRKPRRDDGE
jgi:predicted  nucleic acid-binding Zn-ribbon protein